MENTTVLLLNASYSPMKVISWKDAFDLWFREKAEIVEEYKNIFVKTVRKTFNCPAVMRLVEYRKYRKEEKSIKFNRLSIYTRDNFMCCYCGKQPGISKLTKDHVKPRAHGGLTTWENIVTSCIKCNGEKADRTPEQAKMKMHFQPSKPSAGNYHKFSVGNRDVPEEWKGYLFSIV